MRFIEHGPDIPDELLLALDEERVVFFCGAGVSLANAGLPDFLGLTNTVLKNLRISKTSTAYKILCAAQRIEKKLDLPGLVSVDRIFSELEKEFDLEYIKPFVAKSLKPKIGVNLSAHEILLDLATTTAGRTKLVTTNFDRLFEKSKRKLTTWIPPHLPVSTDITEFDGLVYLHGRVNKRYNAPEKDIIIASSDFGRAYLTEGWARRFFKEIIFEYTVVFIGYSADDPPIRYLLEGRNKKSRKQNKIYAFQSGTAQDAEEKWKHKYVKAIPYNDHLLLWSTLAAWAKRAKNIKSWQDSIIKMARKGPELLSPFEREQVVQLVSTIDGAKRFCKSNNPPPATWLCVFDSTVRFTTPTTKEDNDEERMIEPYQLDSDPELKPIDRNDYFSREVPSEAWDIFKINDQDRGKSQNNSFASLKGTQILSVKDLPERLYAIGTWIAKVSDQNAAVWWAVRQAGIHEQAQERIKQSLQDKTDVSPDIAKAWHYLFDSWNLKPSEMETHGHDWFLFEEDVKKFGWDVLMVKRYEEMVKPRMTVGPSIWENRIPPKNNVKLKLRQLVDLDILYKEDYLRIDIPDECLANVVAALRRNLDIAIRLEMERGYYPHIAIPPIITSDDPDISDHSRTYGFSGPALYYASLFERLLKLNPILAQAEIEKWDKDDDNFYARLRIWSCGFSEIVGDDDIGRIFT